MLNKMDLTTLYDLGATIQYIKRCPSIRAYVKGERYLLDNLKILLKELEELKLSNITQMDVRKLIEQFDKSYEEKQELTADDKIKIIENEKLWTDRITNELSEKITIEVFTDGTLNFKKMLSGAKSFFPEEVWSDLPSISKSDLNDACNCLLTRSWTPAVMISLRSSEDCIRYLYEAKTGNKAGIMGWKKILDELDQQRDINKTLIGYLHYIRDMRNTAEHPDEIFDQMEAERVFHQVVNMAIVIHKELKILKGKPKEEKKKESPTEEKNEEPK